jgi:hypothetical protein
MIPTLQPIVKQNASSADIAKAMEEYVGWASAYAESIWYRLAFF